MPISEEYNKDIGNLLTEEAIETLKSEIQKVKGNEIFCCGEADDEKNVFEIKVLARGSDVAAPAILQNLKSGNVVIHNHPSGDLTPSEADVNIASFLGNQGIGFYIINNNVDDIYEVVAIPSQKERQYLDKDELLTILSKDGIVSKKHKGYEYRPNQLKMMGVIVDAFNEDKIGIIEAGTGIGKSLAYLIPSIYWAVANEERVLISTNTINLQEQLIKKDIPFLEENLPKKFKAVLVKGRRNYLCKKRAAFVEKAPAQLSFEGKDENEIRNILEWSKKTKDGSKSDLNFIPSNDVWDSVCSESDSCKRVKCSYYAQCFVAKARREAASADLLICNHYILFSDLEIRSFSKNYSDIALLPPYDKIILDEAHHIEDVATDFFGTKVSKAGILKLLGRLYSEKKGKIKGIIYSLSFNIPSKINRKKKDEIEELLKEKFPDKVESLRQTVINTFDWLSQTVEFGRNENTQRIEDNFFDNHPYSHEISGKIKNLNFEIKSFYKFLSEKFKNINEAFRTNNEIEGHIEEIQALLNRLEASAGAIDEIFFNRSKEKVYWIEINEKWNNIKLNGAHINVGSILIDNVYSQFDTTIMTSATLTIDNKFNFLKGRLGLSELSQENIREGIFPSHFDYKNHVIIGVPKDIPEPKEDTFSGHIAPLILKSIIISDGRAFVLFTSYKMLDAVYSIISEQLEEHKIIALKQGTDNRHNLLEKFKADIRSVLFATSSFWEGVDVVGEALESIIIVRLPFKVPTEPIMQARYEYIENSGGNPFYDYSIPLAVLRFKQGFGRLIRKKTDKGAILILDKRIVEKSYGKSFLNSLPDCRIVTGKSETVLEEFKLSFKRF